MASQRAPTSTLMYPQEPCNLCIPCEFLPAASGELSGEALEQARQKVATLFKSDSNSDIRRIIQSAVTFCATGLSDDSAVLQSVTRALKLSITSTEPLPQLSWRPRMILRSGGAGMVTLAEQDAMDPEKRNNCIPVCNTTDAFYIGDVDEQHQDTAASLEISWEGQRSEAGTIPRLTLTRLTRTTVQVTSMSYSEQTEGMGEFIAPEDVISSVFHVDPPDEQSLRKKPLPDNYTNLPDQVNRMILRHLTTDLRMHALCSVPESKSGRPFSINRTHCYNPHPPANNPRNRGDSRDKKVRVVVQVSRSSLSCCCPLMTPGTQLGGDSEFYVELGVCGRPLTATGSCAYHTMPTHVFGNSPGPNTPNPENPHLMKAKRDMPNVCMQESYLVCYCAHTPVNGMVTAGESQSPSHVIIGRPAAVDRTKQVKLLEQQPTSRISNNERAIQAFYTLMGLCAKLTRDPEMTINQQNALINIYLRKEEQNLHDWEQKRAEAVQRRQDGGARNPDDDHLSYYTDEADLPSLDKTVSDNLWANTYEAGLKRPHGDRTSHMCLYKARKLGTNAVTQVRANRDDFGKEACRMHAHLFPQHSNAWSTPPEARMSRSEDGRGRGRGGGRGR